MIRKKMDMKVSTLKLSENSLIQLKLSGIEQLEDFNTFSLKELKMLLGESFEEISSVLRRYTLPRDLNGFELSEESIQILKKAKVNDLVDLISFDRHTLYYLFEEDEILRKEINDILSFYGYDELTKPSNEIVNHIADKLKFLEEIDKISNNINSLKSQNKSIFSKVDRLFEEIHDSLRSRNLIILKLKYENYTLEKIGTNFNLTRERVRQIIEKESKYIGSLFLRWNFLEDLKKVLNNKLFFFRDTIEKIYKNNSYLVHFGMLKFFQKKMNIYIIEDKDIFKKFVDTIPKIINFSDADKNSQNVNDIMRIYYVENMYIKIGEYYFKSKPRLSQLYSIVINRFFNEIKIYDEKDIIMFKDHYFKLFHDKKIFKKSNRSISVRLSDIENLINVSRGTYAIGYQDVPKSLLNELKKTIIENKSITFMGLFIKLKNELVNINVTNHYQLHSLCKKYFSDFYSTRDYISINKQKENAIRKKILNFIEKQKGQFNFENLKKEIPGVSFNQLYDGIEESKKNIINIYDKNFIDLNKLLISQEEIKSLKEILLEKTNKGVIISSKELFFDIFGIHLFGVLKRNKINNSKYSYNVVKGLFEEDFNFKYSFMSKKNLEIKLPEERILDKFLKQEVIYISEIVKFTKRHKIFINSMKELLENFYSKDYLRIDEDILISKKNIHVDKKIIDNIINLIFDKTKVINTSDIESYRNFPKLSLTWNKHLLGHLMINFSESISVKTNGNQYNKIEYRIRRINE